MSENSFIREKVSLTLLHNVASFCSECYNPLEENETVFYDTKRCRYLCTSCKERMVTQEQNRNSQNATTHQTLFSRSYF